MAKKVKLSRPASSVPRMSQKERLLASFTDARTSILDVVGGLSAERQENVFLGDWNSKGLLAHLIGWDHTYIAAIQELEAGELPSFYAAYDKDWKSYNSNLVREYGKGSVSDLLSSARQSHTHLLQVLQDLSDEELAKDWGVRYGGTPVTIARLIEAESEDELEHYAQLRRWEG